MVTKKDPWRTWVFSVPLPRERLGSLVMQHLDFSRLLLVACSLASNFVLAKCTLNSFGGNVLKKGGGRKGESLGGCLRGVVGCAFIF